MVLILWGLGEGGKTFFFFCGGGGGRGGGKGLV